MTKHSGLGLASLLMIVFILAMVCLSLLSLSSASHSLTLAEDSLKHMVQSYEAQGKIQQQISHLDSPDLVVLEEYINEDQILQATIENYKIIQSKIIPAKKWQAADSVNLWNGEDEQ